MRGAECYHWRALDAIQPRDDGDVAGITDDLFRRDLAAAALAAVVTAVLLIVFYYCDRRFFWKDDFQLQYLPASREVVRA